MARITVEIELTDAELKKRLTSAGVEKGDLEDPGTLEVLDAVVVTIEKYGAAGISTNVEYDDYSETDDKGGEDEDGNHDDN